MAALLLPLLGSSCAVPPVVPVEAAASTPAPLGAHNDTSTPFNLVSVPALTRQAFDGGSFVLESELDRSPRWVSHAVSYRSGGLRITGVLDVPDRAAPAPLVVLAHGWTDPARYRSGDQQGRERRLLAENGFAALQIDYRNHAGSDREAAGTVSRPLGYPEDLVNAVRAVRRAKLPFVDADRVGLFGRSMGGGVVLNALVAVPGLADAAVLYSPVSSRAADNYRRWVVGRPALRAEVTEAFGTPASRPGLWRRASARSYLDRVDVPLLIHHGTADRVCPARWSRETADALEAAGGQVVLAEYVGEGHAFGRSWPRMMERSLAFLRDRLG